MRGSVLRIPGKQFHPDDIAADLSRLVLIVRYDDDSLPGGILPNVSDNVVFEFRVQPFKRLIEEKRIAPGEDSAHNGDTTAHPAA